MAIKFLSGQTISGTLTVSGNVQGATFNGLAINTTGTNNVANQIVRTQANGYANFGWINSVSGNHTGAITRITASNDAYLRYVTPAQFRTGVTDGFYAPASTVSGVTSVATGNGLTGGTITSTGTLTMSGDYTGTFTVHEGRVWDPTTQGVSKGSIHIDPDEGTDHAGGAITFGASDASSGNNAQAGIYIRSDGSYGTRMYLATTDSYATGSKTALNIDHSGNVNITRGFLQISNGNLTLAGTGRIQGVDTVSASTDAANKAYVDAHPGSGGTVTSVATGNGLTGGTITSTGTLTMASSYTGGFTFSTSVASPIHSGTISSSGDGQNNYPFRLGSDYSAYMMAAAGNTWGLFWAGNGGARYGTNGLGGPGNIWSNSTNPNEFCFVGSDTTRWSVAGGTGDTWQQGNIYLSGTFIRANNNLNIQVYGQGTPVSAITIDNVGSTTFSGYTYFPSYLFHAGDTNTRIQFTTGTITLRGDTSIVLDGPTTTNEIFTGTTAKFTQGVFDDSSGIRVTNPGGGSRTTQASTTTGAIKITLPVSWTNTMMRITIKVYEYTTNESFTLVCGGYNYSPSEAWINEFAYIESSGYNDRNFTVRMGHDGTKCCIYIGELTSTWTYTQIFVTDFQAGYSGLSSSYWRSGWVVDFEASAFGTITYTETNPQINNWARNGQDLYYGSGTGSVGIGTTTPNNKLTVKATNCIIDAQSTADSQTIGFRAGYLTNADLCGFFRYTTGDAQLYIDNNFQGNNAVYSDINFRNKANGGTTLINRMKIKGSTGSIGIGTESPPASAKLTVMGNQTFGLPGNGTNSSGRFISIEGNTDSSGEGSGRIFFSEHNSTTAAMDNYGMSLGYRGGATSIVGASGNTWTGLTQIGNGSWGMWGHNNNATGALVMSGDRAATYVVIPGNVGIGVTSVNAKLHVGGNFRVEGLGSGVSVSFGGSGDFAVDAPGVGGGRFVVKHSSGNVGIGDATPSYKLDVAGTIRATGDVIAYSDARVKDNVKTIDNALEKVIKLRGVSYTRNDIEDKSSKIGVIAQEVLKVLPEVVSQDENDKYSVSYGNITGVLIEAIKEQQKQIEYLKIQIKNMSKDN